MLNDATRLLAIYLDDDDGSSPQCQYLPSQVSFFNRVMIANCFLMIYSLHSPLPPRIFLSLSLFSCMLCAARSCPIIHLSTQQNGNKIARKLSHFWIKIFIVRKLQRINHFCWDHLDFYWIWTFNELFYSFLSILFKIY